MATLPGQPSTALDFLKPLARAFATVAIAGIGVLLCTTVGSLAYPVGAVGAIFGAILGGLFFLLLGCCATGFWRDVLPSHSDKISFASMLPHSVAVHVGGHGSFTVILTVHEAKDVAVHGRFWNTPEMYIDIECGSNPVKRTCVKKDGRFGEQFRVDVDALDKTILLRLKDQDVFGSQSIGYVCVDIQRDLLDAEHPFPKRKAFEIDAGQGDVLRWASGAKPVLVLSFQQPEEHRAAREKLKLNMNSTGYGAVDFLKSVQFDEEHQAQKP